MHDGGDGVYIRAYRKPGLNLTLPEYMKQNKMTRKTVSFAIV